MRMLDNKWALITGASRGVGQQIALGLAKRNCNLMIHARKLENLAETAAMLKDFDVQVHLVAGELDTPAGREKIVEGVKAGPGYVDILYNNAAIQNEWTAIMDMDEAMWLESFQINFFAIVDLCNAFVPGMVERGYGRVINLTSGIQDVPHLAPYGVTKAAVDKYSKDLAHEVRGTNVLVNFLDPGWLRTDLGGENADHDVTTCLPGALVPALLEDNGPTGQFFGAQDFRMLTE